MSCVHAMERMCAWIKEYNDIACRTFTVEGKTKFIILKIAQAFRKLKSYLTTACSLM